MEWKKKHDNNYYIEHFNSEVLSNLDYKIVLAKLQLLVPYEIREQLQEDIWNSPDWHIVLICYEKPSDFCHRHLVAKWFSEAGVKCEEWVND